MDKMPQIRKTWLVAKPLMAKALVLLILSSIKFIYFLRGQKKPILIITLSTMLILAGSLVFSQFYFSYKEVQSLSASCYDQGGFPIIEKSGTKIEYFHCNIE